jgi:hypothetical protein
MTVLLCKVSCDYGIFEATKSMTELAADLDEFKATSFYKLLSYVKLLITKGLIFDRFEHGLKRISFLLFFFVLKMLFPLSL